jgi:TonB family protein
MFPRAALGRNILGLALFAFPAIAVAQQPDAAPPAQQSNPVFRVGGGVSAPSLLYKVEPDYSEEARQNRIQGTVVLYVEVNPDGHAGNIRVVRSLGHGLDEKAIEAVQKWVFRPGYKDGNPVTVVATIEVNFRLADGPSTALTLIQQGAEAFQRRDYEGAKRAFLEATQRDPKSPIAWNGLGRVYAALRDYDHAEEAFKRQIEVNPQDISSYNYAYNNLGLVYRERKQEEEAIVYFQKQIAITPDQPIVHAYLSRSYAAMNRWAEAAKEAATVVGLTPGEWNGLIWLGRTQAQLGHVDEAEKAFGEVLALRPDPVMKNNVAYQMAQANFHLDRAWELVSAAIDAQSFSVTNCQPDVLSKDDKCATPLQQISATLDTAGWILYRQGKWPEAESYLSTAYAITPDATRMLHKSIALAKSGNVNESLKYFAEARTLEGSAQEDLNEARQVLVSALGSESQLEARLKQTPSQTASGPVARVRVLTDENGKVLDVQGNAASDGEAAVTLAKSLTLRPVSWPGHSVRSIRTLEFRQNADSQWSLTRSYVGQPPNSSATR